MGLETTEGFSEELETTEGFSEELKTEGLETTEGFSEELKTEGLETAEGLRGSRLTMGLEGSGTRVTTVVLLGLELLPLGAESPPLPEPELSVFGLLHCSASGLSCNEINSTTPHKG